MIADAMTFQFNDTLSRASWMADSSKITELILHKSDAVSDDRPITIGMQINTMDASWLLIPALC